MDTRERLEALIGVVRDLLDVMKEANHNEARNLVALLEIVKTRGVDARVPFGMNPSER